jgi:hypothetical protein
MLSHRQYSHALRSKERSGTREGLCRKRVKLINLPVLSELRLCTLHKVEISLFRFYEHKGLRAELCNAYFSIAQIHIREICCYLVIYQTTWRHIPDGNGVHNR